MASVTRISEPRETHDARSVPDAAERTVEAARRLLEDWLELARLELAATLRRGLVGAALIGGAFALLAVGWVAAAVAGALALGRVIDPAASVALVALAHVVLGGALLLLARRRLVDGKDTAR